MHPTGSAIAIIMSLILVSVLSLGSMHASEAAGAPSTILYSLPAGSNTEALTTNGTLIFYGSNTNGNFYEVNPSSGLKATLTPGSYHWASLYYYRHAIFAVDGTSGGLYIQNLTTGTFSQASFDNVANSAITGNLGQMLVAGQCPIGDYNFTSGLCEIWNSVTHVGTIVGQQKFWYTAHYYSGTDLNGGTTSGIRFDKMEYLKDVSSGNPAQYHDFPYDCSTNSQLCNLTGPYYGFASDPAGDIWFTAYGGNALMEYVATSNSFQKFTGFTNPAGVAVSSDGATVYIAENSTGIAKFSTSSNTITSTISTPGSYPFGVAVNGANVVWTSSGSDHKVCNLGAAICADTGERNYYPLPLGSGSVAVGYLGSSGVEVVSGLGGGTTITWTTATITSTALATATSTLTLTQTSIAGTATVTSTYTSTSTVTSMQTSTSTSTQISTSQTSSTSTSSSTTTPVCPPKLCNLGASSSGEDVTTRVNGYLAPFVPAFSVVGTVAALVLSAYAVRRRKDAD